MMLNTLLNFSSIIPLILRLLPSWTKSIVLDLNYRIKSCLNYSSFESIFSIDLSAPLPLIYENSEKPSSSISGSESGSPALSLSSMFINYGESSDPLRESTSRSFTESLCDLIRLVSFYTTSIATFVSLPTLRN